jgi:hypothetical protein
VSVAEDQSELAQSVRDGRFGRNVAPGDAARLANELVGLASDPEVVARMRAATSWVQRYAADQVLPEFEAKLREVAGVART